MRLSVERVYRTHGFASNCARFGEPNCTAMTARMKHVGSPFVSCKVNADTP
jgi:hypothetical protein